MKDEKKVKTTEEKTETLKEEQLEKVSGGAYVNDIEKTGDYYGKEFTNYTYDDKNPDDRDNR